MTNGNTLRRLERDSALVDMHREGWPVAKIAERHNMSERAVNARLRACGELEPAWLTGLARYGALEAAPETRRAAVVCWRLDAPSRQVGFDDRGEARDWAQHASAYGCSPSCQRVHIVVWAEGGKWHSYWFDAADDAADECACSECAAEAEAVAQADEERKEAARVRARAWYRQNHERARQQQKRYRDANREKCNAKTREWQRRNREKRAASTRAYYEANKERIKAYSREHYRKRRQQSAEGAARAAEGASSPPGACGGTGQPPKPDSGQMK